MISEDFATGRVCFECIYITGSAAFGCLVELISSSSENYSLTIPMINKSACLSDVTEGSYDILVYDHETQDVVNSLRPAYEISTNITRLSLTVTSKTGHTRYSQPIMTITSSTGIQCSFDEQST